MRRFPILLAHCIALNTAFFLAFAVIFLLLTTNNIHAQTAALFNVNVRQFPSVVSANFFVLDTTGNNVQGLSPNNVRLSEDGVARRILSLSCPPATPPKALSVVLTLDVSGSMAITRKQGITNMEIAKRAANSFIEAIRLGTSATLSEAAITSFDHGNYLNQDWTTDKSKLLAAVAKLQPQGGTDYNAGFILKPAGAIDIAKTGNNKRVVIFLTDGFGSGTEDAIVDAALRNEITLFCVTIGLNAPPLIRNVAQRTGGLCIENVTTAEETIGAFLSILQTAQGKTPCSITWETASGCATETRTVVMTMPEGLTGTNTTGSLSATTSYTPPESAQVRLRVEPETVRFFNQTLNTPQERTITITATNANFTVRDIRLTGDSSFSISPSNFTLRAGESRTLTLRFIPGSGGFAFGEFTFLTDTCPAPKLYASSVTTIPPASPTLRLVFPNGSEQFLAGSDSVITWTGVSPLDTVRLEFSLDSGKTWQTITDQATGLRYVWRGIPNTPSNICLMRVTQLVGSPQPDRQAIIPTDVTLARIDIAGNRIITARGPQTLFWNIPNLSFFSGMQRHQTNITSLDLSLDSTRLATADEGTNIVTWEPNTARITGGLVGNIGRVVGYSPDGRTLAVAGTAATAGVTSSVIRFFDVETNQLLRTITIPGAVVAPQRITFSPDGSTLGLVRSNGTMLFWRVTGTAFGTSVAPPWGSSAREIRDAVFQQMSLQTPSRQGNLLAIALQRTLPSGQLQSVVELWNTQTQRLTRTLTESAAITRIASVNFSRDGSRIITGYANGVSLWTINGVNQDPPRRVVFRAPVTFAEFHPDGRRFLVVTGDQGIFYTFSDPLPLQSDTSDRVWSIVAPAMQADSLDLGPVTVNFAKDSVVRAFIRNTGTYPVRIDSIFFIGTNADEFGIVSGLPAVIPVGGSTYVEFRFRPGAVGERLARMFIVAQHTTLEVGIRGLGVASALQISPRLVDFGALLLGTRRDSTVRTIVRNTGTSPITINGVALGGPDAQQFSLLSATSGFTLLGGETRSIVVRFSPTELGRANGSVLFFVGSGEPVVVQLFGRGVEALPPPPCSLKFLDTAARPNDVICMSLVQSCSEPPEISTSVTVLVSYNATLLSPRGTTPQGVVANGIRYIPITLNLLPVATSASFTRLDTRPLQNLCFDVLLGNTSATRLNLEVLSPPGAFINATSANFRLITSQAGGTMLYFSRPPRLIISSLAPNPANDQITIRYDNLFVEALTLTIVDVYGRTMLTQQIQATALTGNEITVPLREIPAGVYIVRIRSPRETASQRLTIIR